MSDLPAYTPSKDELKQALPLKYVCAQLGIYFDQDGFAVCPFHDDQKPSLYTFEQADGEIHWWCQPCGFGGDIYSLLQRYYNCSFKEALAYAIRMFHELPEDYVPPVQQVAPRKKSNPSEWAPEVQEAMQRAADENHNGYIAARVGYADISQPGLCQSWDRYIRSWGWGVTEAGDILMPHWADNGALVGCKVRKINGDRESLEGSSYEGQLYGAWRGKHSREALITEGETDCIFAACQAAREKLDLDVFALPSGANYKIPDAWMTFLKTYDVVYIAFDPDTAGVSATWKWIEALQHAQIPVKTCFLPLGRDLRDAQPSIQYLLASAKSPLETPDTINTDPRGRLDGYWRPGKDGDIRQVTTWHLEPVAQLRGGGDDDAGFDVLLKHRGTVAPTTIKLADLTSPRDLSKWCNRHGLIFTGRDDDAKRIAEHLTWRGSVVPEVYQTDQIGLHTPPENYRFAGPSVVFPEGYLGKMPWRYVPSVKSIDATGKTLVPTTGAFKWEWLEKFLSLSDPSVTHPLVSWLVASARRPEAAQFPLLFIAGSSGVGKSTLARLALRMMGSKVELDLGANTPFILIRTLASTTSVPVFIDEWTRMSRKDTREAFQGAIPILYAGGTAERGQADLSSTVYRLTAPVVVAGEDRFMLDREIERMIAISPSRSRQNSAALTAIIDKPLERFGQLLHSWLTTNPTLPEFDPIASTRVSYNRHVLETGWKTLQALLMEAARYEEVPEIPDEPDLSEIERALDNDEENVYEQALLVGMSMRDQDGHQVVWSDLEGRGTWVRFQTLVGLIQTRNVDLSLPGGSRSMKAYFEEQFGQKLELGASVVPPGSFTGVRAWLIPGHQLPESDDVRTTGYMPA